MLISNKDLPNNPDLYTDELNEKYNLRQLTIVQILINSDIQEVIELCKKVYPDLNVELYSRENVSQLEEKLGNFVFTYAQFRAEDSDDPNDPWNEFAYNESDPIIIYHDNEEICSVKDYDSLKRFLVTYYRENPWPIFDYVEENETGIQELDDFISQSIS